MKTRLLLILFTLSTLSLQAQTIESLNWISGYWTSSDNGMTMEELWTTESSGILLGVHRDSFPNGNGSFEYLRIVKVNDEIQYIATPNGGSSTVFKLTESSTNKAIFENLDHDFPQRIIYTRDGDALTARIEDESGEKGMQWTWLKTNFD